MKKILFILSLILVFVACTTESGEISSPKFSGSVVKYQYGSITYLLFQQGNGGVAVVNYTSDSMEYEFLRHSTKPGTDSTVITTYGGSFNVKSYEHDPGKTE